jgi:heme/copper-type cytochrome/quinol oxidase subunit 2
MLSFWFFKLWKLSILGILLLIIYFVLKYLFGVKTIPNNLSKSKLLFFDLFLYVHPILIVALIWWYTAKPFNQIILLPQGYTGVVVIDYDKKDGQEKKWMNRFLGIGGSRLIKIDTNGYAKTKFKHFNQSIPILEIENDTDDWEGTKLYYENNLHTEIAFFTREKDYGSDDLFKKITKHNLPIAYSYQNSDEELVFIVGIGNDYYKYFYNKGSIENDSDYYLLFSDSLRMEYKERIKKLINK